MGRDPAGTHVRAHVGRCSVLQLLDAHVAAHRRVRKGETAVDQGRACAYASLFTGLSSSIVIGTSVSRMYETMLQLTRRRWSTNGCAIA